MLAGKRWVKKSPVVPGLFVLLVQYTSVREPLRSALHEARPAGCRLHGCKSSV
jgi:hypothetical protein